MTAQLTRHRGGHAVLDGTTQRSVFKGGVLYVDGAAEMLSTTPKAIYSKVARRLLPFYKLEGRVIFFRDDLEQFLRELPGCNVEEAQANVAARTGEAVGR